MQDHQSADGFRHLSNYGFVRLAAVVSESSIFRRRLNDGLAPAGFLSLATAAAVTVVTSNRQANVFQHFHRMSNLVFRAKSMGRRSATNTENRDNHPEYSNASYAGARVLPESRRLRHFNLKC